MKDPHALHENAAENLVYIRGAMERASSFTAVPGWGAVVMGLAGLAAAILAPLQATPTGWLVTWLAAAALALPAGILAILFKSQKVGVPFLSSPARQFALGFSPAILVGALVTVALVRAGNFDLLPGTWLLLYGAAVVAGGVFSVRIVPLTGLLFLFLGAVALFAPPPIPDVCLGLGFGGLNLVFGILIARNHGG